MMAKEKFTCPDCGREVETEGLCEECKAAYTKATECEGKGEDLKEG